MKKLLLILLLTIFSNGVMAKWGLFEMNDDFDAYVDIASKRKSGKKVKIWTLRDYKSPQTDTLERQYLSTVEQREFNCFNETYTYLSFTNYTENMQNGSVINTYTYKPAENKNIPITPNTISEGLFKIACIMK